MNTEEILQLHDRATCAGVLSADERARLQKWYAEQDQAEAQVLARGFVPQTARLRAEVDEAIAQLVVVSQQQMLLHDDG